MKATRHKMLSWSGWEKTAPETLSEASVFTVHSLFWVKVQKHWRTREDLFDGLESRLFNWGPLELFVLPGKSCKKRC